MKKALLISAVCFSACTNFDVLVERCVAEGRCGGGEGAQPVLAASPSTLSFTVVASEDATPKRLTISNSQGVAQGLNFTFGGVNAGDFKLANQCGTSLPAGQSCEVDVSFAPAVPTLGIRQAVLEVRAASGSPLLVQLSGEVTLTLEAPEVFDFGDVATGTTRVLDMTVRNLSSKPASVVPSVSAPFSVGVNTCSAVAAMQTCRIELRFDAPTAGERETTLILGLAGSSASQSVTLRARSVTRGQLQLSPFPLFSDAGATALIGTTTSTPVRLTNVGAQFVKSFEVSMASDSGAFVLSGLGCDAGLAPGASCDGVLSFNPSSLGFYPVRLSVDAGDIGSDALHGVGRGTANITVTLRLVPADAGTVINHTINGGGSCANTCVLTPYVDPADVPQLTLTTPRTAFLDVPLYTGSCSGPTCSVPVNTLLDVTAIMQRVPVGFVTQQTFVGNFGGIAGADDVCNRIATDAGLYGTFQALLGLPDGGGGLARWPANQGFISVDGGPLLTTLTSDLTLPWRSERGTAVSGSTWTALLVDGGVDVANTCRDWTAFDSSGSNLGIVGEPTSITNWRAGGVGWNANKNLCGQASHLFCLGAGTGQPMPLVRDGGVLMFVARSTALPLNDGGSPMPGFNADCSLAAQALGFPADAGRAYVSATTGAAASFATFDGGLEPLVRLDGLQLAPSWTALKSNKWTPQLPVRFAVAFDGGISAPTGPIFTSSYPSNWGSFWSNNASGANCAGFSSTDGSFYSGNAQSTTAWWAPESPNGSACSSTRLIYCVVAP